MMKKNRSHKRNPIQFLIPTLKLITSLDSQQICKVQKEKNESKIDKIVFCKMAKKSFYLRNNK